jgi:WD40 repeat protein
MLLTAAWNASQGKGAARFWRTTGNPLGQTMTLNAAAAAGSQPPPRAAFSPDGKTAAVTWDQSAVLLFLKPDTDALDAKFPLPVQGARIVRHQLPIRDLAFSSSGRRLVTASDDGTAQIWAADTGLPIGESVEHQAPVLVAMFGTGDRTLLTYSGGVVRLWESSLAEAPQVPRSGRTVDGALIGFAPAARFAYVELKPKKDRKERREVVLLFDPNTGDSLGEVPHGRLAVFPDSRKVLVYDVYGSNDAQLWDVATGKVAGRLRGMRGISDLAISPDGQWLAPNGFSCPGG